MINDITYINDNEPRYSDGDIYYYHGDHLGSATWITDATGAPVQYIQYLPTGEIWQNITAGNYNERFKFTGKEHDEESGYDYFGARYYWSLGGIWTAVDPLADKYPSNNPYMYCSGNPLKYVDPDGMKVVVGTWYGRVFAKIGFNNFEAKVQYQLLKLKDMDPELNTMITALEDSPIDFRIKYINNKNNHYDPKAKEVGYDSNDYYRKDGEKRPPEAALAHELGHAENDKNGTSVKYNKMKADGKVGSLAEQAIEQEKRDRNEVNSIYYENIVREKEEYPQRGYNYSAGD